MKKLLALVMASLMVLTCAFAMAEETLPFEGTQIPFEDYGFAVTLPNDWKVMEVPDESAEAGIFFIAVSADGARTVQILYTEMDEAMDGIDALVADLSATYENVTALQINGIDFATFTIPEQDIEVLVCLGGSGIGLYGFYFTPSSDTEYAPIAQAIAGSIVTIESAE